MSKPDECPHVSATGRRCQRDEGHEGAHWLEAEPSVHPDAPEPVHVKASAEPVLPPRPDTPRALALEYREPDIGRVAAALVYLTDTLREHWKVGAPREVRPEPPRTL